MNRKEIRDRILLALNDSPTDPQFWSTEELDDVIQDSQEVLAEEVEAIKRTAYKVKHDGMQFVTLASIADDVMAPYRLWDNENERLHVRTMRELDKRRQRWLEVTADRPDFWYPVSWNMFGIYPATANGGGWLRIDYLAWPTALLDDEDKPETMEADHDALVTYGIYFGLMKQWDALRALDYFQQFVRRWADSQTRHEIDRLQGRIWTRHVNGHDLAGQERQ